MSVLALESECMKSIAIHLVDKSDFIPSDHKTRCKFCSNPVELAKSEDCDFSCIKFALQKVSVNRKYKLAERLTPYFASWCASPP